MEETNNTKTIVGVRFRTAGKVYYFDPNGIALKKGDHVIVETARGIEYGLVICDPMELPEEKFTKQLKPVLQKNEDVIFVLQAGFVGAWGEWYYTTHFGIRSL